MWLAILLLGLAAFQTYLFSSVIRCSMYISRIEEENRRRATAFDRCSERVRLAKEQGVWRPPSLDMSIQKKTEEDEGGAGEPKRSSKKGAHVQWSTQTPAVAEVDETLASLRGSLKRSAEKFKSQSGSADESAGQHFPRNQRRRSSSPQKDRKGSLPSAQSPLLGEASTAFGDVPSTSRAARSERRSSREAVHGSSSRSPNRQNSEKTGRRARYSEPNAAMTTRRVQSCEKVGM
ncbi:hypothetical protein COOONC_28207 [Cooperia oncophora]